MKLCTSHPAPATSAIASAISSTIIADRIRDAPRLAVVLRPPSLSSVRSRSAPAATPAPAPCHAGEQQNREREEQHPAVERHRLETRQLRGAEHEHDTRTAMNARPGRQLAPAAESTSRFGQQLTHDPAAAGAERRAHA